MTHRPKYRAVNITELKNLLDRQCSPNPNYMGYVIGPDAKGRLSHVASCRSMSEAFAKAEQLNKEAT